MKNVRTTMSAWFNRLDERWRMFPVDQQRRYTMYLFTGYLLLTAGVIFKIWFDNAMADNKMVIAPIENPVLKKRESPASLQDTVVTILKEKIYEGK